MGRFKVLIWGKLVYCAVACLLVSSHFGGRRHRRSFHYLLTPKTAMGRCPSAWTARAISSG